MKLKKKYDIILNILFYVLLAIMFLFLMLEPRHEKALILKVIVLNTTIIINLVLGMFLAEYSNYFIEKE